MAFTIDFTNRWRVIDLERGYEVFNRGGTPDGIFEREIIGPEGSCWFSCVILGQELTADERAVIGDVSAVVIQVRSWDEKWRDAIRESLLVTEKAIISKSTAGNNTVEERKVFVRFGYNEDVFGNRRAPQRGRPASRLKLAKQLWASIFRR